MNHSVGLTNFTSYLDFIFPEKDVHNKLYKKMQAAFYTHLLPQKKYHDSGIEPKLRISSLLYI